MTTGIGEASATSLSNPNSASSLTAFAQKLGGNNNPKLAPTAAAFSTNLILSFVLCPEIPAAIG
jgi:hypothetical protein